MAVALEVGAIEEVGLVAEAAGHPLPAEVVAGRVAIEQVAQKPLGTGLPADAAPVHQVGRQPHAGVVVQPARAVELGDEAIHAGQTGAAFGDVGREFRAVGAGMVAGFELFLIAPDPIAQLLPEALPVVAPAELIDQLFAVCAGAQPGEHGIAHLCQAQRPVADVGREAGHRAIEEVAPLGVPRRLDAAQQLLGLVAAAPNGAEAAFGFWEQPLQLGRKRLAALELARQLAWLLGPAERCAAKGIGGHGVEQSSRRSCRLGPVAVAGGESPDRKRPIHAPRPARQEGPRHRHR